MTRKDAEYQSHPTWASLQISRVSGQADLFGSQVQHQHFIELRVCPMKRKHDLGQDWYYAEPVPYIEIQMTAAQFAEAITSLNMGNGIPVTLHSFSGKPLGRPPKEDSEPERVKKYVAEQVVEAKQECKELQAKIDEILAKPTIGKGDRALIKSMTERISKLFSTNLPFYTEQFTEATERVSSKAATEFEAMVASKLTSLGLSSMQSLLQLGEKKEPEA
jgi:hypothetical protein